MKTLLTDLKHFLVKEHKSNRVTYVYGAKDTLNVMVNYLFEVPKVASENINPRQVAIYSPQTKGRPWPRRLKQVNWGYIIANSIHTNLLPYIIIPAFVIEQPDVLNQRIRYTCLPRLFYKEYV